MAATKIADILVPDIWVPYMQQLTTEKSNLWASGVVVQNDELNGLASGGGTLINMPYFNDLSGDSQLLNDNGSLTVNKITTGRQQGAKHFRGNAWGSNDLAAALSGADPMDAIASLVANYWSRDFQRVLIASLRGLFAAASMSTNLLDISVAGVGDAPGSGNRISATAVINATAKLGDEINALSAIAMHSDIYYELERQDLITFEAVSEQGAPIRTYRGKTVIVDDSCPRIAYVSGSNIRYHTYLFGPGAVAYGEGDPETPVESDRDSLAGEDILINRRHFILHPQGSRWTGTAAGVSPSNAELQTGTNWLRVYDPKNVKIVVLVTNG